MTTDQHPSIELEERWHRILDTHTNDPVGLTSHILTDLLTEATTGWRTADQDGDRTAAILHESVEETDALRRELDALRRELDAKHTDFTLSSPVNHHQTGA